MRSRRGAGPRCWGLALAMALVLSGQSSAADPGPAGPLHHVVMHLNSGDEQVHKGVLTNIRHLYQEVGRETLQVELVAHGAGLKLFVKKDTRFAMELVSLKQTYGVEYTACSNTMKAMGLTRQDLIEQVDRTEPAMVRIMELQEQGWAYIKP